MHVKSTKPTKKGQSINNSTISNSLQTTCGSFSLSQALPDVLSTQPSSIQKRVKFSDVEDEVILSYVKDHGKKWAQIAERLQGRTGIMVRNRYYVKLRQMKEEEHSSTFQSTKETRVHQQSSIDSASEQQSLEDNNTQASQNNDPIYEDENEFVEQSQQQQIQFSYDQNLLNATKTEETIDYSQPNHDIQQFFSPYTKRIHQDFFENANNHFVLRDDQQIPPENDAGENQEHTFLAQDDDDFFEEASMPFKIPQLSQAYQTTQNNYYSEPMDSTKQEKIKFLQNQIAMIESMLNTCKNEIIRELADRNVNFSSVSEQYQVNNPVPMQEHPLKDLNNNHMDIEIEGKMCPQGDHDQFGCFSQLEVNYPHEYQYNPNPCYN